jgi:hypothetical protein
MTGHLAWIWLWFLLGMATYWAKRAYYLVTGPNPIASTYSQFIERCWIPLLVRAFLDSLVFWTLFTPGLADRVTTFLGWTKYDWLISVITSAAPVAAVFGHTVDSLMDFAVSKLPWVNGVLPQMPGPIPTPSPTNSQASQLAENAKETK